MPDPFPNELVEAVEEACTIIENRCGTVRGIGPAMREALAAVLPLIEQRVIDKLAGEADGRVQRLQDAIHAADRELITIADFSIQEAADAIDSVRAGLKDALAETDVPAPDDARSVPDQFPAIDLAPERTGEGT